MRGLVKALGENVRPICDRFWLFTVAALALGIICAIVAAVAFAEKKLSAEELALFGSLSTGLLMIVQKVLEAQQTRRLADQLHQSSPTPEGAPLPVRVDNDENDRVPVNPR